MATKRGNVPTQSWRGKSAVIHIYCALTSNGYSKSIYAVRRKRNLGLGKLLPPKTLYWNSMRSTSVIQRYFCMIIILIYHDCDFKKMRIQKLLNRVEKYRWIFLWTTQHKGILPSYGTTGSMIPRYLFCLFLCTAAPPAGFSIYIFIKTTVTFIGTSGHSVQMS